MIKELIINAFLFSTFSNILATYEFYKQNIILDAKHWSLSVQLYSALVYISLCNSIMKEEKIKWKCWHSRAKMCLSFNVHIYFTFLQENSRTIVVRWISLLDLLLNIIKIKKFWVHIFIANFWQYNIKNM